MDGKVSLILGGAGWSAKGIVRSFLEEGAFVVVTSRSPERLAKLRAPLGSLANERLVPAPGNAPVAMAMAGRQVLQPVLAEELRDSGVRINQLLVKSVVSKARGAPGPEALTAEEVGSFAARLASDAGSHWHGVQIRLLDQASDEIAMR